jgi:hypothetical protein
MNKRIALSRGFSKRPEQRHRWRPNAHTHSDANSKRNCYGIADDHSYGNGNVHASYERYAHGYSNPDVHTESERDTHLYRNADCYSEAYSQATGSIDTKASPLAAPSPITHFENLARLHKMGGCASLSLESFWLSC